MKNFLSKNKINLIIFFILIFITIFSGIYFFEHKEKNKTPNLKNEIGVMEKQTPQPTVVKNETENNQIKDNTIVKSETSSDAEQMIRWENNNLIIDLSKYPLPITENTVVYDVMKKLEDMGQISFETKDFPGIGKFIEEIDGVKNDEKTGKYWIYYINGESAKIGISQQTIKSNDIITWKYEEPKF